MVTGLVSLCPSPFKRSRAFWAASGVAPTAYGSGLPEDVTQLNAFL